MLKRWNARKREEGTFVTIRDRAARSRRRTVVLLLLATALCGWLYLFFGSGMFRVTAVEAEGLVHLDRGEVSRAAFEELDRQGRWPWQWRNILLIDEQELERALKQRLYAQRIAVEKSYPHILRLKVEERSSSVIVIANNEVSLVDRQGVVVRRITNEEEAQILERMDKPSPTAKTDLPVLTIRESGFISPGEAFVTQETMERWLNGFHDLGDAGFGYRNAILETPTSTKLILDLFEAHDVYMDLLAPLKPQIASYYAFTKAKEPEMVVTQYIDVRVPGKVFYK